MGYTTDNVIEAQKLVWWSDYDGVLQPSTIRNKLTSLQQAYIDTIASHTRAAIIITNSDPREVRKTFDQPVFDARLKLIGEHGSCADFEGKGDFVPHPDLTIDRSVLPELAAKAKDLLAYHQVPWTDQGDDLHNGQMLIKVEQKFASFCLVRSSSGFQSKVYEERIVRESEKVMSDVMAHLADEFNLYKGGWELGIGSDAHEFFQDGFSKKRGVTWAIEELGIEDDCRHVMFEDGNDKLLAWKHERYGALNVAVGNNLPSPEKAAHIFGKVAGIPDYWEMQKNLAHALKANQVNLDLLKTASLPPLVLSGPKAP